MEDKTNVMRMLDKLHIPYRHYTYPALQALSGVEVAQILNRDPAQLFKTLVTVAKSKKNYVFVIPSGAELNLKKAASAVKEKSIEMLKSKELLPLTGYVHGGCSPLGMKKTFPTVIDLSAQNFDTIIFSAGKIGFQVEVSLTDLHQALNFSLADLTA